MGSDRVLNVLQEDFVFPELFPMSFYIYTRLCKSEPDRSERTECVFSHYLGQPCKIMLNPAKSYSGQPLVQEQKDGQAMLTKH